MNSTPGPSKQNEPGATIHIHDQEARHGEGELDTLDLSNPVADSVEELPHVKPESSPLPSPTTLREVSPHFSPVEGSRSVTNTVVTDFSIEPLASPVSHFAKHQAGIEAGYTQHSDESRRPQDSNRSPNQIAPSVPSEQLTRRRAKPSSLENNQTTESQRLSVQSLKQHEAIKRAKCRRLRQDAARRSSAIRRCPMGFVR